jgi:hypothetical protein
MPYASVSEVPDYVPESKRKQWLEVWNSAYARAKKDGKEGKAAEQSAFAQANAVAGPNAKMAKSVDVHYEDISNSTEQCQFCVFYNAGTCSNIRVQQDDKVPINKEGQKAVAATGWCDEYKHLVDKETNVGAGLVDGPSPSGGDSFTGEDNKISPNKFVKFAKVDASKREVWGVVTAEVPDKDDEVCDYDKSKPYYQEVIGEMSKATDGANFMPLRAMHRNEAVGKGIGYEFRDADKEIFMGFKVVDDKAWKLVEEKVYTGFSHGGVKVGDMWTDPVFKDCMRYVAKPAEVSLVDNPCLGVAHFTYISKTGEVELRKNRCVPDRYVSLEKFNSLASKVTAIEKVTPIKSVSKAAKTKRVAGEDLSSSAFLIVGDPEKTETWHLPVKFSSDAKTKRHIRNALARINQVKGISETARASALKRLHLMASSHGIGVDKEKALQIAIFNRLRKMVRVKVSRLARTKGDPGWSLTFLDQHLAKLQKGMCEISHLACVVNELSNLVYCVVAEQEWEQDETSPLPGMLEESVDQLLDTLVAMAQEEADELRDELDTRLSGK